VRAARPGDVRAYPSRPGDEPSVVLTVVITFFFGVFGLIPASIHAARANRAGLSGKKYWVAFGVTMGVELVFWMGLTIAFYAFLVSSVSSNTYGY
jgi:hypothetical protein